MSTWDILNIRCYQIEFYVDFDLIFSLGPREKGHIFIPFVKTFQCMALAWTTWRSVCLVLRFHAIFVMFVFLVQNNYAFWWYIWSVDVICQNCLWNYPLNWKSWPTTRHINSDIRLHGFLSHQLFKRVITIYPWRVNPCTHKGLHFRTKNQLRCFDTTHQLQGWSQKLDNFVAFQGTTEALRAGWLNLVFVLDGDQTKQLLPISWFFICDFNCQNHHSF